MAKSKININTKKNRRTKKGGSKSQNLSTNNKTLKLMHPMTEYNYNDKTFLYPKMLLNYNTAKFNGKKTDQVMAFTVWPPEAASEISDSYVSKKTSIITGRKIGVNRYDLYTLPEKRKYDFTKRKWIIHCHGALMSSNIIPFIMSISGKDKDKINTFRDDVGIIAIDWPGTGFSSFVPKKDRDIQIIDIANLIIKFITKLNIKQTKWTLSGYSDGTHYAMSTAALIGANKLKLGLSRVLLGGPSRCLGCNVSKLNYENSLEWTSYNSVKGNVKASSLGILFKSGAFGFGLVTSLARGVSSLAGFKSNLILAADLAVSSFFNGKGALVAEKLMHGSNPPKNYNINRINVPVDIFLGTKDDDDYEHTLPDEEKKGIYISSALQIYINLNKKIKKRFFYVTGQSHGDTMSKYYPNFIRGLDKDCPFKDSSHLIDKYLSENPENIIKVDKNNRGFHELTGN